MTSLRASVAVLLASGQAWAAQRTSFSTHFRSADTALVGAAESSRPIPRSEQKAGLAPLVEHSPEDILPVYPCELRVRVRTVIKAKDPVVEAGAVVPVVWYLRSPACTTDYRGETLIDKPALWLLRTENGSLRALVDCSGADNTPSVLPIKSFPAETEQKLAEWKDPRLAVTYLILKPGVIIPENAYARSLLPGDVAAVAGYLNFLKVLRTVYLESGELMRDMISLNVASYGSCLGPARRALLAEEQLGESVPHTSFLDIDVQRKTEEVDLRWMQWTTKEQLLQELGGPAEAVDGLTMLACRTNAHVKARARELLSQYFGIEPSSLPCIPCE